MYGLAAGESVDGAGDVDGDGRDDLVLGLARIPTDWEQAVAVVLLSPLEGTLGIMEEGLPIRGTSSESYATRGTVVAGAGDTDADGFSDVLVLPFKEHWSPETETITLLSGTGI